MKIKEQLQQMVQNEDVKPAGGHASRWQWGPETRVPAGFYPIRGWGWASFHPRGAVVGHIIQPDTFRGFAPVSVVPEPETRQYSQNYITFYQCSHLTPEILEALMCSQDWIRNKYKGVSFFTYIIKFIIILLQCFIRCSLLLI